MPAPSVALYVLVIMYLLVQVWPLITSPLCVTTTAGQLSEAITAPEFGAGTVEAQLTVTGPGQVRAGDCVSVIVTVNEQSVVPHKLVVVTLTFVTPELKNDPLPFPLPDAIVAPVNV